MSNRGIGRGRMFMGGLLLFAAVITWAIAALMSPHGQASAQGPEHVKGVVVTFLRNTAIGTMLLSALSAWLLFPARRPRRPLRDWAVAIVIAILFASSIYELIWLKTAVLS